jgi:vitamin B12 transporter
MVKKHQIALFLLLICTTGLGQHNDTLPAHNQSGSRVVIKVFPIPYNAVSHGDSILTRYSNQGIAKLLTIENGIYIKSYGLGGLTTFSKRGASSSQTQLLWNGIPVNSPSLGQQDLSLLPLLFSDNLVVDNTSTMNGGLEGAIHFSNSHRYINGLNVQYSKELGSFGLNSTTFKSSYGKENWSGSTALYKNEGQNNFTYLDYSEIGNPIRARENAAFSGWGFSQNIYRKNDNNLFSFHTQYTEFNRQIPSAIGVSNSQPFQFDNSLKTTAKFNYGKRKHQLVQLGYIRDELQYTDTGSFIFSNNSNQTFSANYRINAFKLKNNWKASAFLNGLYFESNSTGYLHQHNQLRGIANISVVRATTYSNLELRLRQEVISETWSPLMPSLSLSNRLKNKDKWNYMVQLHTNYRYPTLNDLYWNPGGNENLNPEKSVGGEMNIKFEDFTGTMFKLAYYYSITDNWIQWLPSDLGYWTPQNVKKVERQGIELSIRRKTELSKMHYFVTQANYTFVNAINKSTFSLNDGSLGKQLIYVPHHTIGLSASYVYRKVDVTYQQQIYSRTYIDAGNTTYLPYIAPASLHIGGTLLDNNMEAYFALRIENIFNETYQIIANQPLPGRFFSVVIRVTLKQ